jgi:hypothetical protein
MLVEIYIFFQIVVIGLFLASFFTKQEILWSLTFVFASILAVTSFNVEQYIPVFNSTINAYSFQSISYSYPYLMGVNIIFATLSIVLGFFDIFEKYGLKIFKKSDD